MQRPEQHARSPIQDYAAAVARHGETLGVPTAPSRVRQVLKAIAADSIDVFGSQMAAEKFLAESPIDNGMKAAAVAQSVGISRILSRIDGLRFGVFA